MALPETSPRVFLVTILLVAAALGLVWQLLESGDQEGMRDAGSFRTPGNDRDTPEARSRDDISTVPFSPAQTPTATETTPDRACVIRGTVADGEGAPISDAVVAVKIIGCRDRTNEHGSFQLIANRWLGN